MSYDDVISLLGEFGRYQRKIYFLLCLPAILCAFQKLGNVFLVAEPNYRCKLPTESDNASYYLNDTILSIYYPKDELHNKYSSCEILIDNKTQLCESYIFDHEVYGYTSVIEFGLTCSSAYLIATSNALFMVGVMLGSIIFGEMSDRIGRKITFFISLVILVVAGLVAAIAPELWTFTVARLIVGATTSGVFLVAYVIGLEMVGPSKRPIAGTVVQMFFSLGYMLTAAFAYYIDNWRWMQFALTIPGVAFFVYWWFIPESARWLLTKNRVEEAKKLIQEAAKYNDVVIPDETLDQLLESAKSSNFDKSAKAASVIDIFKYPNMRKKSLIIFFDWFANNLTYYGLSWNTNNLAGMPTDASSVFDETKKIDLESSAFANNLTYYGLSWNTNNLAGMPTDASSVFDETKKIDLESSAFANNLTYYGLSWNTNNLAGMPTDASSVFDESKKIDLESSAFANNLTYYGLSWNTNNLAGMPTDASSVFDETKKIDLESSAFANNLTYYGLSWNTNNLAGMPTDASSVFDETKKIDLESSAFANNLTYYGLSWNTNNLAGMPTDASSVFDETKKIDLESSAFANNLTYYGLSWNTNNLVGMPTDASSVFDESKKIDLESFANNLTYYGLSWNTNNLAGNPYLNFVMSGAVEIPAFLILLFLLNKWGRRNLMCCCMLISGISLLLTMIVPDDKQWLIVTLAMIGKLTITSSYGAVYILSTEQFPTVIRNAGLGAGSTFARFGSILAPYMNALVHVWQPLPLLVFGTCALIGGLMSLVLPETLNKKLPETMEEGEQFGKKTKKLVVKETTDDLEALNKVQNNTNRSEIGADEKLLQNSVS